MLSYAPADSPAHRLDPRTKLFVQVAFVAAAFAHTTVPGLAVLTVLGVGCLLAAGGSVRRTLWAYRFFLPFLLVGPLLEALTVGDPWIVPGDAVDPLLASYRVALVFLVSGAYVRSTPVRESRAAVARIVPGRLGRLLGVGLSLVFRFLPVLKRDLFAARDAMRARLGDERPVRERMRIVATAGLNRAFGRADRLSVALRARCFAWNPTLPDLRFSRLDLPAGVLGLALCLWAVI